MAAYFCAVLYYAAGPERVARWVAAYRKRSVTLGEGACELGKRAAAWAGNLNWRDPESMLEIHI